MGFWFFPLYLGFYVVWVSGYFLAKSDRIWVSEALRFFNAFYYQFTDNTKFSGSETAVVMFNPHAKFEMSTTITCNEEMKCNAKCENSPFEPPFGDLGVTHSVHLWLDGKRIVDFVLATIQFFSLALTAGAQVSEICQTRRFLKGWVTLSANVW